MDVNAFMFGFWCANEFEGNLSYCLCRLTILLLLNRAQIVDIKRLQISCLLLRLTIASQQT